LIALRLTSQIAEVEGLGARFGRHMPKPPISREVLPAQGSRSKNERKGRHTHIAVAIFLATFENGTTQAIHFPASPQYGRTG
jgi:hypothetical protein